MRRTALAQLAVIIVSGLLLAALPAAAAEMTPADAPPAYVGSESCTACHRAEAKAWKGSHHGLAWTAPTPENVRADFDGTEFSQGDMTARFRIEPDGSYHVTVTETDGVTTDYRVHSVAGVYPLQQYLIETEPGRLQSFDVVWDSEKGGWFSLSPDGPFAPDDGMHWTGPYKNWNGRCAECHATGFVKHYDATAHTFASTEAEIGVGCEACHGPGSAHAAWASGPRKSRGTPPPNYGFSVDFSDREATLEQCATCHSRREPHFADEPLPGTPFHDSYNLSLLMPGLYQADGQILDEVYVYGSFLQSKMHAKGVTCLDCHEPHSATLRAEGNAVCAQCHNPAGNTAFPSLRLAEYDSPEHHFHEPGTPGSECKNCHMVERVYMGNDWRADHSLRVPRPDLDAVTGAPRHESWTATRDPTVSSIRRRMPSSRRTRSTGSARSGSWQAKARSRPASAAPRSTSRRASAISSSRAARFSLGSSIAASRRSIRERTAATSWPRLPVRSRSACRSIAFDMSALPVAGARHPAGGNGDGTSRFPSRFDQPARCRSLTSRRRRCSTGSV